MTSPNDPFADRPYTPRDQRDDAPEPSNGDVSPAETSPPRASEPEAPAATGYPTGHEYADVTPRDHDVTEQIDTSAPAAHQPVEHTGQLDREPTTSLDTAATGAAAASGSEYGQPTATNPSDQAPSDPLVRSEGSSDTSTTGTAAFGAAAFAAGSGSGGSDDGGATTGGRRPRRGNKLVAAVALVALAGAAGYGGSYLQGQNGGNGSAPISSLDSSNQATQTNLPASAVEQVASKVLPSVVQVNVKGASESGSGTGIIISSDGEILTNNHVVAPAAEGGSVTVAFSDGTNAEAEIVGRDPVTDVAVIKAEGQSDLQPASLGSSDDLKVGQDVVAIGSPFGLESTVTTGIVSALNRPVTSSDGTGSGTPTVFPAVQTDAAINPGNSGGPLVDLDGNVIGINSAIRAGNSGGQAGSIGLGFAIPVDLAKNISQQILAGEQVEHAQIGVTVRPAVSGDEITGIGAEINEVSEGSAGAEAGLQQGDIITAVNGNPVASSDALVASIRAYQPGESVSVTFLRDGESQDVDVELGSDANAG